MLLSNIVDLINNNDSFALVAHIMPDGDTIGSCLALRRTLLKHNKKVSVFCEDNFPKNLNFMKDKVYFKRFESKDNLDSFDVVIAIDCSDIMRMGNCKDLMEISRITINIDHHVSNTYYAQYNYVDNAASATGEIIFNIIKMMDDDIDLESAVLLYTAISTDTGNFSYSNTTSNTHKIVAELMNTGINADDITGLLYRSHTLQRTRLLSYVLHTLELFLENRVAILHVTKEMINLTGADNDDTEGFVNYAKDIKGVDVGILLREVENSKSKISLRSNDNFDVNKLALIFGGGGHKKASGCIINKNINEAKKILVDEISNLYKELY